MTSLVGEEVAVRPFRIDVPEEELVDLRRRVAATRWPDRETVTDQSQGVQLAKTIRIQLERDKCLRRSR